jgi:hypothetical protein
MAMIETTTSSSTIVKPDLASRTRIALPALRTLVRTPAGQSGLVATRRMMACLGFMENGASRVMV